MVHVIYCHLQGKSFRKIETLLGIPKTTTHRWYTQCSDYFNITNTDKIIDLITEQKD